MSGKKHHGHMPVGFMQYEPEAFLKVVTVRPQTTTAIAQRVHETLNKEVSWATAQRYLETLEKEGKIVHSVMDNKFHIWHLKAGVQVQKVGVQVQHGSSKVAKRK